MVKASVSLTLQNKSIDIIHYSHS